MWVRGLKHLSVHRQYTSYLVAPYVGAWIETRMDCSCRNPRMSHPMWVRGLKHANKASARYRHSRTLCGCVD